MVIPAKKFTMTVDVDKLYQVLQEEADAMERLESVMLLFIVDPEPMRKSLVDKLAPFGITVEKPS